MAIELVTGKAGKPHVDSCDDAAYHAHTMGTGCYVLHGCACTMANANTAHIAPGELLVEGRHFRVTGTGEDVTVENGTQGQRRNDLICVRYEMGQGEIEDMRLVAVKGGPDSGEPADPSVERGSILAGDRIAEHPLYRIPLDDVNVGAPVLLFERLEPLHDAVERIDREAAQVVPVSRGGTGADALDRAADAIDAWTLRRGVEIGANADLNACTDPGNYACPGNVTAATLKNCPVPRAFTMQVFFANGSAGYVGQRLTDYLYGTVYFRSLEVVNNTWTSWRRALDTSQTVSVSEGGTGAADPKAACANLGAISAYQGEIHDMSWEKLYSLAPGSYIVLNYANQSPMVGHYGNLFVSLGAGNRVTAFVAFDNGACFVAYGADAANWTRVDNGMFNDGVAEHGWSGSFEYFKYNSGFARVIWKYGASTAFNAYATGYMYASGRFAFPFPMLGLVGATAANNLGTNVLNAYPIDIRSDSFAFYIGALSPTHSPWQVCFEFTGKWK